MKFIAVITNRVYGDLDGKGWPTPPVAKEFDSETPIKEIWDWYKDESLGEGGLLEIMCLK